MINPELSLRQRSCYRLLQIAALFLACYFTVGKFAGIHTFSPWHMVCAGLSVLLLTGINYAKLRGRLLCLFAVAGGFVLLCLFTGPKTFLAFWNNYLHWIARDGLWNEDFIRGYELVQSAALASVCYLLQLILEHFPPLRKILSGTILAALLLCMLLKYSLSHPGFVFCFWYLILTLLEEIQRKWMKNGKHHQKLYMVRIMPFCIAYLIFMLLAPASEEPYQWQWVKDLYRQAREYAILCSEGILRGGNEDFSFSGFSGDGKLAGGLQDSHRHVLTVQGSRELVTNIYLTGKVYDSFDGTAWQQNFTEDENDRFLDALETVYAVSLYDDLPENYIAYASLNIKYEHFSSGYLFAPLKTLKISDCSYTNYGDCLLFEEPKGYGTSYSIYYTQLNLNEPAFYRMAETGQKPDESVWNELAGKYTSKGFPRPTVQELEEHRIRIQENYTEQPVLSRETEAYLQQITLGAETDLQKLLAIESELSTYTYTKNPGQLPGNVTDPGAFLDYFLLENRQGYCSYFATAFVLLARAEGLPARYVEGFCIPAASDKSTTVYTEMAHAWPEVYLEGVGWIPFEPTPGYEELRYTPWQLKQKSALSSPPAEEPDFSEEDASDPGELPTGEDSRPAPVSRPWPDVMLCILLLCLAAAAFWMAEYHLRRRHYRRMSREQRLHLQVGLNLWLLSKLGFTRNDAETLQEFRLRLPLPCAFISCYEEILYGDRPVTEEMPEEIYSERKHLLALVKNKRRLLYPLVWLRLRPYENQ